MENFQNFKPIETLKDVDRLAVQNNEGNWIQRCTVLEMKTHILGLGDTGAANTGVTAAESGLADRHVTVLTVSVDDALTLGDNVSLADGYLIYTLPTGDIVLHSAAVSMEITNAEHDTEACDIGLGTTIASGAVATLDGTPAFENILTGQTGAIGTNLEKAVGVDLFIASADDHTVHFNVAAAWADTAGIALDADIVGYIVLEWSLVA